MSEEEVQNKESSGDQEILKKNKIVEDIEDESDSAKEVEGEKPTNGIHSSSEEDAKPKDDEKDEKETSFEDIKDDETDEKDENSAEASKNEESKADKSEDLDESAEDSKVDESINNTKNETNEDEEEEEEEDEEEEDESMDVSKDESVEETPKKGILEQPVEMKGKRERRKVERFVQEAKKEEVEVEGRGTALKEIAFIQNMILKTGPEDLKHLHRLAYNRPGTAPEIRKNLYKFRGFPFTKDDKAFDRKKASAEKIVIAELKKILNILGLERSGVKGVLVERLMNFLLEPYDAGKQVAISKRRKSQGKKRGSNKKKKEKGTKESQSADSDSDSDEEKSDDEEEAEEEEEEQEQEQEQEQEPEPEPAEEESANDSESEEEEPVKKPKKKAAAKPTPKKTPARPKKTPKAKPAKTPRSQQKKRPKESESEGDSDDSSASEEKPKKKAKKSSPTDAEIETFIKKLLDKADLNEVTMKKLCQQVYDNYPGQDISHKKDFIKATVKSILS